MKGDSWGIKQADKIRLAYRDWQDNPKGISWETTLKAILSTMLFFSFVACSPVYIPQKVLISTPVFCQPAKVPPFVNYISPIRPQTKAEEQELTAEIEVTMEELVSEQKLLREALIGCEGRKK